MSPTNATAHPLETVAREAYAHGWARSGGPMNNRVRAGCEAAVALAIEHADDRDILEVTLKLGQLEGMWAKVFERREGLIQRLVKAITELWQKLTGRLDPDQLAAQLLANTLPGDEPHPKTDGEHATAIVRQWLNGIADQPSYNDLQAAVTDALRAGTAEGGAEALAVAAEQQEELTVGTIGFDFDIAFEDAYRALASMDWPADTWVQAILQGNGSDVGAALADAMAEGATHEELVGIIADLTGSADVRAVATLLDMAVSRALNQGAVNLYASEGIGSYDILTAGDTRVCIRCEQAEAANPHPTSEPCPVSIHPGCRCAVAANEPLNPASYQPYLPKGAA